jgi:hypothetical protein
MAFAGLSSLYTSALGIGSSAMAAGTAAAPYIATGAGLAWQAAQSKPGQALLTGYGMGLGGSTGKATGQYVTGTMPCGCKQAKPQYSCPEKCAYKEMMKQKCNGCTSKYITKKKYGSSSYTPYSYGGYPVNSTTQYRQKYGYQKSGKKYLLPGKDRRLAARDAKKSTKYPRIQRRKDVGGPKWGKRR